MLYFKKIGVGPPLVLLHGWGWHSGIWQPILPTLLNHYQIILIDLPGFGKSHHATNHDSVENIALQLLEIVETPATWLGWSLGGLIAWWIAIHFPKQVEKLMTVTSSPCFLAQDRWPGLSSDVLQKFKNALTDNYQQTLQDFLTLQLRGSSFDETVVDELKKQFSHPVSIPALVDGLKILKTTDLRQDLKKISCPNLHIFGSLDRIVPVKTAEALKIYLPEASCEIIPHAGHMPFLSQPEVFFSKIRINDF